MERYEDHSVRFVEFNRQVANHVMSALTVPQRNVLNAVLPQRRRESMGLSMSSKAARHIAPMVLHTRRLLIRYLCLPRVRPVSLTGVPSTSDGHYWALKWSARPWYVELTVWSRCGPPAWIKRPLRSPCPDDEGDKYRPGGYALAEIGFASLHGKGRQYMRNDKARLEDLSSHPCPFLSAIS